MLFLLCIPLEYPLESRGQLTVSITDLYPRSQGSVAKSSELKHYLIDVWLNVDCFQLKPGPGFCYSDIGYPTDISRISVTSRKGPVNFANYIIWEINCIY